LAVGALLVPVVAPAGTIPHLTVWIANDRDDKVFAMSGRVENCYGNLVEWIPRGGYYHFDCRVKDESKPASLVVRLLLEDRKIACEGYMHTDKASVTLQENGARCAIERLRKDQYRFTIR